MRGNPLEIGSISGAKEPLILSPDARARHTYVCGGTGVGKSKLLEECLQQDIYNWRKTECGLILFDPHGEVYRNTMAWLAKHDLKRPVVPIELRRNDWIVSYNLLRKRVDADASVIVSNFVRALSHVWGEAGTDRTPLFARWATFILLALYHSGCTISDVMYLLSRPDVRRALVARMTDQAAIHAWKKADNNPKEFENDISSTLNRFQRLAGPQVMKATFGQPDVSLDLLEAINEGQIILVNLSSEGGQIEEEDAHTYGILLLTDLWAAAKDRGKHDDNKPFYVYIDECQNFVTPTIAKNLDQARGFGLHLMLANQYPTQILNVGESGKAMYDSILAIAENKIVFRIKHPEDAKALAQQLFMSTLATDKIKLKLESTKIIAYREEVQESVTEGTSTSHGSSTSSGGGSFHGESAAEGESGGSEQLASMWNNSVTGSSGESANWTESESEQESTSHSVTRSTVLKPVMGKETSSVQYMPIEEQIFQAMQKVCAQDDRNYIVSFYGGPKAPVFGKTPTVLPANLSDEWIEKYRVEQLKSLAFAMPMTKASEHLAAREAKLLDDVATMQFMNEPTTAKKKVR
jgi:hypothetical protein